LIKLIVLKGLFDYQAMIVALQIGKKNSEGLPGKNIRPLLGRPLMEYPLIAADACEDIEKIYISTDSSQMADIASKYSAEWIKRPDELSKSETLTEDVLVHAYDIITKNESSSIEFLVILLCNCPNIKVGFLSEAISILRNDNTLDSVFSVSEYNMFSPMRARKLGKENIIEPYVDLDQFNSLSSIRDEQETCYYADLGVQVVRPRCILEIEKGMPPIKWMGKKSYGLVSDFGFDLDAKWQVPVLEYWLKENSFTLSSTPFDRSS